MRLVNLFLSITIVFILTIIITGENIYADNPDENQSVETTTEQSSVKPGDEIIYERTENAKKYYLGEDIYAIDVAMGPIHYKDNYADKAEMWKDIDLNMENGLVNKTPYIL
ncbi:MAG: hypothetical protein JXA46_11410 [Dehalococcoidales bacterium]|nr:hypothetical protein [Dehalococcoidales bacterium]